MRWIWIDRFVEFESGKRATAIKNVSLAEDHLHDHFPGFPTMPASLIIEGLAQTGGILVGQANAFAQKVILGKISRAKFHDVARPGDQLTYRVELADLRTEGAMVEGQAFVGDRLLAEVELFFVHLDQARGPQVADRQNFVFTEDMKAMLRQFEVERESSGQSLLDGPPDAAQTGS